MEAKTKKNTIRVRVISDNSISENKNTCEEQYRILSNEDRERRIKELKAYHDRLTILREEEQRLKNNIVKLQDRYNRMKEIANGISTEDLWKYCDNLNDVSKGKYKDKEKKWNFTE